MCNSSKGSGWRLRVPKGDTLIDGFVILHVLWFRDVVDARAMRTLVIVVPINGVVLPVGLRGRWCHASQLTRSRFPSRFNLCRTSTGLEYDKTKKRTRSIPMGIQTFTKKGWILQTFFLPLSQNNSRSPITQPTK